MQIMKYSQNVQNLVLLVIVSILVVSCNSDGPEIEQPEKIYYDLAQKRMDNKNFIGAIESLEAIESKYPFGRYAEQAQVELIYAYFMNGQNLGAHAAAEKFIRLYPRHPNIDYAYFMKGLSSYTRDKDLINRYTNTDISNRDITGAMESFTELTEFLTRFPESQYAPYAKQRNIYLRNMIARNELAAADFYQSSDAHVAAIGRAKYVIENIPNSSENFRALKILEKSYKALGYEDLREDILKIIKLNYSENNTTESESSNWSWNFIKNSQPKNNPN